MAPLIYHKVVRLSAQYWAAGARIGSLFPLRSLDTATTNGLAVIGAAQARDRRMAK
jgi:hypothetical protein